MIFIFFVAGLMLAIGLIIFFAKELKESNHEIKRLIYALEQKETWNKRLQNRVRVLEQEITLKAQEEKAK